MIPLLIGILLFVLFIVTIVLSASTWRGWHIAVACLTFLAVVGLVICASLSVKTHSTWQKRHAETEVQLAQAKLEGTVLEYGDPMLVESVEPSLLETQHGLNRILLDRGRVWRQCSPGAISGNTVQVMTVPIPLTEANPNADVNNAKPNGIIKNMILYAFRENESRMPVAYLGEFQVTDAQPTSVTMQNTMPLDGLQQRMIADKPARWTLYEMMPIDSHRIFFDEDIIDRPLDDESKPVFGEVKEQDILSIFAQVHFADPNNLDPSIVELASPYVDDGKPASEQIVNERPENIWLKLEFEKPHVLQVDSNNLDPGLTGNFFDPQGLAEVTRLRAGGDGKAKFRINDVGLFPYCYDEDKRLVDELIAGGFCTKLGPMFVRTLRDYEYAFHDIQDKFVKRNEGIRRATRDIAALNTSIRKTQQQTTYRQQERAKLKVDLDKFNLDKQKVTDLVAALELQKKSTQAELSDLFQTNLALSQQLAELDARLTKEINRRAADVAVRAP